MAKINRTQIDGGLWDSAYTSVSSNSAGWESTESTLLNNSAGWESTESTVNSNSSGWESTESTVNSNSANWNYQGTDIKSLTSNWQSTYSSVNSNSSGWESVESTLLNNSAGWESTESTVNSNSAGWESTESTVNSNSSNWNYQGTDIKSLTGNWESTYSNVNTNSAGWESTESTLLNNSAGWESTESTLLNNSAGWESTESTVNSNSANWNYQGTDIKSLTSNWQSTYTTFNSNSSEYESVYLTVSANSADWELGGSGADTEVRALTSNWQSTYSTVNSNSADWSGGTLFGSLSYTRWNFTGSEPTSSFTITGSTSDNEYAYLVTIDTVVQDPASYTIDSTLDTITFSSAPETSSNIVVIETFLSNPLDETNLTRELWVGAGAMIPRTAASTTVTLTANNVILDVLDFDYISEEAAGFSISLPDEWDGGALSAKCYWTANTSNSGNIVWGLRARANANGDNLDSAFGTEVLLIDTFLSANQCHITSAATFTIGNTADTPDLINFEITREVANGSDTLSADSRLLGVKFLYRESVTYPVTGTGGNGADTEVRALTSGWESTYSTVSSNSADWGGGDFVLLSTKTASASSSLIFDDVFSSTYDNYVIYLNGVGPATDADRPLITLRDAGSDVTGTTHYTAVFYINENYTAVGSVGLTDSNGFPLGATDTDQNARGYYKVEITPRSTTEKRMSFNGDTIVNGSNRYHVTGFSTLANTTVMTGFKFRYLTGNIAHGSVSVYGIKK